MNDIDSFIFVWLETLMLIGDHDISLIQRNDWASFTEEHLLLVGIGCVARII